MDLYKLTPPKEHPHGLSDRDFDTLFTTDKPIIFNFHGYPWLIHRLAYRRTNHANLHVRGYKEKGNINTPLELAINNEVDRFSLAIDVIDRVPRLQVAGAHVKEKLRNLQIECRNYAHEHGIDRDDMRNWKWPLDGSHDQPARRPQAALGHRRRHGRHRRDRAVASRRTRRPTRA